MSTLNLGLLLAPEKDFFDEIDLTLEVDMKSFEGADKPGFMVENGHELLRVLTKRHDYLKGEKHNYQTIVFDDSKFNDHQNQLEIPGYVYAYKANEDFETALRTHWAAINLIKARGY